MENRSFRKSLAVAVVALFLGVSVIPSVIGDNPSFENTIIVDDEGDGDYTVIQDAVDNATEGDTILVYSGTYLEADITTYDRTNPIIGINLKGVPHELGEGNDVGKPRIVNNGMGSLLRFLWADRCTIQGFELANCHNGITLTDSANNTIINNTIISCKIGIELEGAGEIYGKTSYNNIVENNTIIDSYRGIFIEYASTNVFRRNVIKDCHWGIDNSGSHNIISYNQFLNNGGHNGGGILIVFTLNNIIEKNHFEGNVCGVLISSSFLNIIRKNNFIDSKEHHATFVLCQTTVWNNNFWGEERILPQPIFGMIWMLRSGIPIPGVQFDWHPAREPYDIP